MGNARKILITTSFLWLALTGCSDEQELKSQLSGCVHKVERLSHEAAAQSATRTAELLYIERKASAAAGCDWLIPICPAASVQEGRQFIADGNDGTGLMFWVAVIAKLASLGAFAASATVAGRIAWYKVGQPTTEALAAARATVAEAQTAAAEAKQQQVDAERRQAEAEAHLADAKRQQAETITATQKEEGKLAAVQKQLQAVQAEMASAKADHDSLLNAFDA